VRKGTIVNTQSSISGDQIGAYRMCKQIGAGTGCLAEHSLLGRHAAIKVFHPSGTLLANAQAMSVLGTAPERATPVPRSDRSPEAAAGPENRSPVGGTDTCGAG
jgi:hypothetical protein